MKIIIKDENGQLAICSENEKPISESRIWATLSLALASSIADRIQQKNLPPELKKALIETTSERVAAAVKNDFVRIASSNTKGVWKKAQNVLVDGKLTWLLDEDWLWPKTITPAKQASLLCEIRKLMPPVVYATSADGVVVCMVPCTGYTRTAVNVTAEEMNELWSVKPQQRAAAQGALQYGWQHPLADPRSYNEKGERLQNVYNRKK